MSGMLWTKFYFPDWANDPGLRASSLAARGLWMDMLCLAARHDPPGYVAINGQPADVDTLARMVGASPHDVEILMGELERNGVFSRNRTGMIYSRRMVRDVKRSKINAKNGQKGGMLSLGKTREISDLLKPPLEPPLKPSSGIKPRSQKPEEEKEIDFQSISKKKADEAPPGDDPPRQAFPAEGSIHYTPFAAIIRAVRPAVDPDVVAAAFRRYAVGADPPIRFDDPKIGKRLAGFARAHRMGGLN